MTETVREVKAAHRKAFIAHLYLHAAIAVVLIVFSLAVGIVGYRWFTPRMSWTDAYLNAAMLLGGMGPVGGEGQTDSAKIFAGTYALYCGLVFVAIVGIMLNPIVGRVLKRVNEGEKLIGELHRHHLEVERKQREERSGA